MAMSNARPRKHITKIRAAVNAGPGAKAPSGTGDSYPATGIGGGFEDRCKLREVSVQRGFGSGTKSGDILTHFQRTCCKSEY